MAPKPGAATEMKVKQNIFMDEWVGGWGIELTVMNVVNKRPNSKDVLVST
jgi:hypothetical protein